MDKQCLECNEDKPISEFPCRGIYKDKNLCYKCVTKARNANRYKKKNVIDTKKQCVECNDTKPNGEFPSKGPNKDKNICKKCVIKIGGKNYYEQNKKNISVKQKVYLKKNKVRKAQSDKEYRNKNTIRLKEKSKKYYEQNKEHIKNKAKQYRNNNKEKKKQSNQNYRKNNIEKIKNAQKIYRKNNLIKCLLSTAKVNDSKKKLEFNLTEEDVLKKLKEQNNKCFYCNIELLITGDQESNRFGQMSIDRKDSTLGHTKNNCVISCLFCNRSKSASDIEDFKLYINAIKNNTINDEIKNQPKNTKWATDLSRRMKRYCAMDDIKSEFTPEIVRELYKKQEGNDYFTKLPLINTIKAYFPFKASIDRLDNDKPHTLDNCVLVCHAGNMGRNEASKEKYIEYVNKIKQLK